MAPDGFYSLFTFHWFLTSSSSFTKLNQIFLGGWNSNQVGLSSFGISSCIRVKASRFEGHISHLRLSCYQLSSSFYFLWRTFIHFLSQFCRRVLHCLCFILWLARRSWFWLTYSFLMIVRHGGSVLLRSLTCFFYFFILGLKVFWCDIKVNYFY